jgi:hypothetical protein
LRVGPRLKEHIESINRVCPSFKNGLKGITHVEPVTQKPPLGRTGC